MPFLCAGASARLVFLCPRGDIAGIVPRGRSLSVAGTPMLDFLLCLGAIVFFAVTAAYADVCDRL